MKIHPKVIAGSSAGTLGGALSVVLLWVLSTKGFNPPSEVADAIGTIITVGVGFIAAYRTPSPEPSSKPPTQPTT